MYTRDDSQQQTKIFVEKMLEIFDSQQCATYNIKQNFNSWRKYNVNIALMAIPGRIISLDLFCSEILSSSTITLLKYTMRITSGTMQSQNCMMLQTYPQDLYMGVLMKIFIKQLK